MSKINKIVNNNFPNNGGDKKKPNEVPAKEPKVEPNEEPNVTTNENTNDLDNIESIVDAFHKEQAERELKSETMGNYTLVINHKLMGRLDTLSEHYPRGFKSELVNKALETFVSLYEKKPLPAKRTKRGRR
jgi:hypothetical protein